MSGLIDFRPVDRPRPAAPLSVDQVPLQQALLCDDCEMITRRSKHGRCGHCQSDAVISLARVLGRPSASATSDPVEVA